MASVLDCDDRLLIRELGARSFDAARSYLHQGRVLEFAVADDGSGITGRVLGRDATPYQQSIGLGPGARPAIAGQCSCPVGYNCKHVAAVILAARQHLLQQVPAQPSAATRMASATLPPPAPRLAGAQVATLPDEVLRWIAELGKAEGLSREDYPEGLKQRLLYVLLPAADARHADQAVRPLAVRPVSARLLKEGGFGEASPYDLGRIWRNTPKFIRPSDLALAARLLTLRQDYVGRGFLLADLAGAEVLAAILATGRARWQDVNGPALSPGPRRAGRISWRLGDDACLRPWIELDSSEAAAAEPAGAEGLVTLLAAPPVWVDPAAGLVGPIETGLAAPLVAALLAAPPIAAEQAGGVAEALARQLPPLADFAPPAPAAARIVEGPPRPRLRLLRMVPPAEWYWGRQPTETLGLARLSFGYGAVDIAAGDPRRRPVSAEGGRLVEVRRQQAAEQEQVGRLRALGLAPVDRAQSFLLNAREGDFLPATGEAAWLAFLWQAVPALRSEGWEVAVDPDFPVKLALPEGDLLAELREGSGIDWLELALGVTVDGERLDLVPILVRMILSSGFAGTLADLDSAGEGAPFYVPLPDGRTLGLPAARIRTILATLAELVLARGGERIRLGPQDAAALATLEDAGLVFPGERLKALGRQLRDAGGIPVVALPPGFGAALRPYQARGVAWLQFLRQAGLGGVLADDMGLGKTVQALAHVAIEQAAGRLDRPALVVAPTSLVANWQREAERFAPALRLLVLHGLARRKSFERIAAADLVITTYPLLARDWQTLEKQDWHIVILDEAQTIKNPDSAMAQAAGRLTARQRLCLTGTPMENHLGELWSLFTFALPGFLGDRRQFIASYRTPIEKHGDGERARILARRVRPFMLRRTKEAVAGDLPPKTEITEPIELGKAQRDVYEAIRIAMHEKVRTAIAEKGFGQSRIVILDALLKLRQACCDPRLLKLGDPLAATASSAKLNRLAEMVDELLGEGRRILIFSQFTSMLSLVEERLRVAGIDYALLTGDTRDRPAAIARFQEGAVPLFLVSLKAGGTGLNLTAADTVILYDPWWNPAVEDQAVDRAHRIGQAKPIFVHRLVALDTIEEKMDLLKQRKRALAEGLFDDEGLPTLAMTESDIELLLG